MEEEKYSNQVAAIKDVVARLGEIIEDQPKLKEMNFGLFYQHGRLAFVDLDNFADKVKAKTEADGEEKTLAEIKKEIDTNEN